MPLNYGHDKRHFAVVNHPSKSLTAEPTAAIDLAGADRVLLPNRLMIAQRDAVAGPAIARYIFRRFHQLRHIRPGEPNAERPKRVAQLKLPVEPKR
jgi:hypothetical protein